jgi:DNA modification methylase
MMQKRITWKLEKRNLQDLKPHAKNPRQFTEKGMKDLEKSINSIGFMQPININQDGTILSGHARTLKLKEMGEIEVDVYVPDRLLTPKQEEEVLVRANANTAGQWDFEILANEFDIDEINEWGLEVPDMEVEELEAKEDDFDGEPPVNPKTVLGDLYEIGNDLITHKLLCGDSTDSDTVAKLMNGKKADMVFTDPPYLIEESTGRESLKSVIKSKERRKSISNFNPTAFLTSIKELNISAIYIFTSKALIKEYLNSFDDYNFNVLFWKKPSQSPLFSMDYLADIEYILYFNKKGRIWNTKNKFENYYRCREVNSERSKEHPTVKPINLITPFLENSSNINSIILDFFLGSGSTMVASHQLKRKCYGMELDPKYCDVIVKRMIKLDPSLKLTRNGEDCKNEFMENNG